MTSAASPGILPRRYVAPAGAPIGVTDLLRWAASLPATSNGREALRQAMDVRWGPGSWFVAATGRAGMTLLLRAMRRLRPDRDEVIVPAYTCYSVPAAAVKAGLRVRIVDVDPDTLDYDPRELADTDFRRVLALVATNLYGRPSDLPALMRLANGRGSFLVDDAAQAMGARVAGRWSGTAGDAGLFSFDKGKNVSSIDGGVVFTTSKALADALADEWRALPEAGPVATAAALAKVGIYAAMLRPRLYGIPTRLPFLGLGRTVFATDFPLRMPPSCLAALAAVMLRRLDQFTAARVANARALTERLRGVPGIRLLDPGAGTEPVYLRLPVSVEPPLERDAVVAALNRAGIGATASYPAALVDVGELRPFLAPGPAATPGGRALARRIMTLPTHPFVSPADIERIGVVLTSLAAGVSLPASPATRSAAC